MHLTLLYSPFMLAIYGDKTRPFTKPSGVYSKILRVHQSYSKQLENAVFLKLKRSNGKIFFGALSSGKEIDFITETADSRFEKYQVTQTLNKNNYDRELSSFLLHDTYLEDGKNILLTLDDIEEEIDYKNTKVFNKNLIRWLLGL